MPVSPHEKAMQRALIQYRNPKNYDLVEEALKRAGRTDLIGYDRKCLIRPRGGRSFGEMRAANGTFGGKKKPEQKRVKKKTIRNIHKKKNV